LLTNALKFTPSGKRVRFSLAREGDRALLRVEDEGGGIAPEMLERIFEPFVRAGEPVHPNRQAAAGLGLGPALVKSIVRRHGGEVKAESRGPGQGSCFVVSLPSSDVSSLIEPGLGRPSTPSAVYPTEASGRTVVVVEDQEDSREVLREYLASEGWK